MEAAERNDADKYSILNEMNVKLKVVIEDLTLKISQSMDFTVSSGQLWPALVNYSQRLSVSSAQLGNQDRSKRNNVRTF